MEMNEIRPDAMQGIYTPELGIIESVEVYDLLVQCPPPHIPFQYAANKVSGLRSLIS